jgi:hypothetical protein
MSMNEDLHFLSIDPGEKTTGWAAFDAAGQELEFGKVTGGPEGFMDWLENLVPKPAEIIYENYRINPTINHGFSKVVTIQLIGMIKRFAHTNKILLHEQPNTVLKIGLKYAGFYSTYYDSKGKKKKHVDDQISAYAHGVYYLQKKGIRKSRVAR